MDLACIHMLKTDEFFFDIYLRQIFNKNIILF